MATLNTVLTDIAAIIDQDTAAVTGTDLSVRVNLVNQAQREWAETYQWKDLQFKLNPSFGLSATSLGLPSNFKKLMSPVYDIAKTSDNEYREITRADAFVKDSTDRYVTVNGNDADGRYLFINPALISGASVVLTYQAYPSSVATLADTVTCPNPQFITNRVLSHIMAARSDERFPQFKAYADDQLSNLIEEESTLSGGQENTTPNYLKKGSFTVGVS